MVTVVLLLMLLMAACGSIILITVLSNTTTVDAVAEKQAQRAAEAGMQMALNVLRGNATGSPISFRDAAIRTTSNKGDDWMPRPRLSKWLNYNYPATQPDRVTLTPGYDPYNGLAFSVIIDAPDAVVTVIPTPNPDWVDGPVVKPVPPIKPPKPAWHPWDCAHCSWDYTHCSLYNPPNNGTLRSDGMGCRHKHCIPPPGWGAGGDDGYQRLRVTVTGYGPRGARKELEALVKRTMFDYEAEPLIFVQGANSGTPVSFTISGTPEVKFDSGDNIAFLITNAGDQTAVENMILLPDKVTTAGKGDDYEVINFADRPKWLVSADDTRSLVTDLREDARARGRYFTSFPANNAGTDTNPQFTFVDGDAQITSAGNGLMIVTGRLIVSQSFTFKGVVLVLGGGGLEVTGGDAKIEGTVALAKFGLANEFLPAAIDLSGIGRFELKYNASRVDEAMKLVNMRVMAVREQ